jgi:hypothetical protein
MPADYAISTTPYAGWRTCWRLFSDTIEAIVTGEVGPRVIRFGFVGGENEFKEFDDQVGRTGGSDWRSYGGHRLWHAPEVNPRTYAADNEPVRMEHRGAWTGFIPPVERENGIGKEMWIRLLPAAAGEGRLVIRHVLRNHGPWAMRLAPWAITVMAPGGTAVVPLPPRGPHEANLVPTSSMALWAYTDISDPRWSWLRTCVLLRQDPGAASYQKIGLRVSDGWAAYARAGHLLVKGFVHRAGARYPDLGCNVECFTNADMLELETLGPLVNLEPGCSVEHGESWTLWRDVPVPASSADVEEQIVPKALRSRIREQAASRGTRRSPRRPVRDAPGRVRTPTARAAASRWCAGRGTP